MNGLIDELSRAQLALRHLTTITEQATEGIIAVNSNGILRFANTSWAEMHGYEPENELIGKQISEFHSQEQMKADVLPFMEEAKNRGRLSGPVEHMRRDGTTFPTHTKMTTVKDEDGRTIGLLIFAVELTKQRQTEEQLRNQTAELNQTKELFQQELIKNRRTKEYLQRQTAELNEIKEKLQRRTCELSETKEQLTNQTTELGQTEELFQQELIKNQQTEEYLRNQTAELNQIKELLQQELIKHRQTEEYPQRQTTELNEAKERPQVHSTKREQLERIEQQIAELESAKTQIEKQITNLKKNWNLKDREGPLNDEESEQFTKLLRQHWDKVDALKSLLRERDQLKQCTEEKGPVLSAPNDRSMQKKDEEEKLDKKFRESCEHFKKTIEEHTAQLDKRSEISEWDLPNELLQRKRKGKHQYKS